MANQPSGSAAPRFQAVEISSSSPRVATVPDVIGLGAAEATDIIEQAGLTPYGPAHSTSPETGTVTEQDPELGQRAVPNAPVVLTVAPGGIRTDPDLAGVPVPG
jgi:beta-lactam-binding protein with PASTA domain